MNVKTIVFTVRKPKEQYGFEEATMTIETDEEISVEELVVAKSKLIEALESEVVPEEAAEEEEETEEVEEEDDSAEAEDDNDESEGDEEEEEKTAAKKKSGKAKGPAKKKKGSVYSRSNEIHKKLFSETLKEIDSKWNSSDKGKAKGKKISQEMEGEEFLDADGEILESFAKTVAKKLKAK